MGDRTGAYRFWWGDLMGALVEGRIILKWILKQWDWEALTGLIILRIGTCGRRL
jgi:hypothetical protein